jgi:hypothetical protein
VSTKQRLKKREFRPRSRDRGFWIIFEWKTNENNSLPKWGGSKATGSAVKGEKLYAAVEDGFISSKSIQNDVNRSCFMCGNVGIGNILALAWSSCFVSIESNIATPSCLMNSDAQLTGSRVNEMTKCSNSTRE